MVGRGGSSLGRGKGTTGGTGGGSRGGPRGGSGGRPRGGSGVRSRGGSGGGSHGGSRDGSHGGSRGGTGGGSSSSIGCDDPFADERVDQADLDLDEDHVEFEEFDSESLANGRGSNHVDPIPPHPDMRTWVYPLGRGFTDPKVNRQVIAILRAMFNGPWDTWKKVPKNDHRLMLERFSCLYQWDPALDAVVNRNVLNLLKSRFSDVLSTVRTIAIRDAEADGICFNEDFEVLKPYNPKWIDVSHWATMIDKVWNTEKWKIKSLKNKQNKATLVDGELSKHTAGSVSFELTKYRMEKEKGGRVTSFEWYKSCHTKKRSRGSTSDEDEYITEKAKRTAETYKEFLVEKYGPDESNHPPIGDFDLWVKACGGLKRGSLVGFAMPEDPCLAVSGTPSIPSTASSYHSSLASIAEVERFKTQLEERDKIAEDREKAAEEREKAAAEREKKMLANMEMIEEEVARQRALREEMEAKVAEFNELLSRQRLSSPPT